jgi:uncharacterized protein
VKRPVSFSLQDLHNSSPAPNGCRSAIVIDKEGSWFYNGLPIINRRIQLFFFQLLETAPDGGYLLRNGQETCPVEVEDTPFVVTTLWHSIGPPDAFFIKLNDDTIEALDVKSVVINAENIPYCTVKQGRFRARFLRAPYYVLAESVQQEGETSFFIELNGERHYLRGV